MTVAMTLTNQLKSGLEQWQNVDHAIVVLTLGHSGQPLLVLKIDVLELWGSSVRHREQRQRDSMNWTDDDTTDTLQHITTTRLHCSHQFFQFLNTVLVWGPSQRFSLRRCLDNPGFLFNVRYQLFLPPTI